MLSKNRKEVLEVTGIGNSLASVQRVSRMGFSASYPTFDTLVQRWWDMVGPWGLACGFQQFWGQLRIRNMVQD